MHRLVVATIVVLAISGCSGSEATCRPDGTELRVIADDHHFDTNCLAAPADQEFTIAFRNDDTSSHGVHNLAIRDGGTVLFDGEALRPGGTSVVYEVQPLPAGNYAFRCNNHPFMGGTFVVN
jgi:plastocyanin